MLSLDGVVFVVTELQGYRFLSNRAEPFDL